MNDNFKQYFVKYMEDSVKQGIKNFVKEELKKIEEEKEKQIKKLEEDLPKEAERIAAEIAIDTKLWHKLDEFGDNLRIQLLTIKDK